MDIYFVWYYIDNYNKYDLLRKNNNSKIKYVRLLPDIFLLLNI